MKAVIPTGPYANLQPEITVEAETIKEAQEYLLPHIDELFGLYLNRSERREPTVTITKDVPATPKVVEVTVTKSETFFKAENAINNAQQKEVLVIILDQILASSRLSESEKQELIGIVGARKVALEKNV
jgi:tRNA C32,U32 (ribose-2'-O)-methylase TrmJ